MSQRGYKMTDEYSVKPNDDQMPFKPIENIKDGIESKHQKLEGTIYHLMNGLPLILLI